MVYTWWMESLPCKCISLSALQIQQMSYLNSIKQTKTPLNSSFSTGSIPNCFAWDSLGL